VPFRFGDWKEHLGISDAVLSARLSALVDAGVLAKVPYRTMPARFEYHLDEAGRQLWSPLLAIWAWEQHHLTGQHDRLPDLIHGVCGVSFEPELRCGHCHERVSLDDVVIELGPSGDSGRSVPVGTNRRRGRGSAPVRGPGMFPETMALIGSRWSSALLGAAFLGASRFTDFEQMLGAPPKVVTDRLRIFVSLGVLEQRAGQVRADRGTYHLTDKGRAFFPVVALFLAWGERWRPAPDGPAVLARHRSCGAWFAPELGCSACGKVLHSIDVRASPADLGSGGRVPGAFAAEPA